MIVLGIDTAIRNTGYGVIDIRNGDDITVLDCGIIKNKQKALHSECMRRIAGGIRELIETYSPECSAIEGAFYQKNVRTAMILSLARGAAITVLAEKNIPVFEYAPKKAKQAVVGSGMASKAQVATMISAMSGVDIENMPLDSTDAIAFAICHGQTALRPGGENLLPKQV